MILTETYKYPLPPPPSPPHSQKASIRRANNQTITIQRYDVCFYDRRTTRTIRDRLTRTKRRNGPGVTCRRPDGASVAGRTWRPRGVNGHNRTGRTYTRRGANGSRAGRSCTADGENADGRICSRRAGASGLRIRYGWSRIGTPDCRLREMAKNMVFLRPVFGGFQTLLPIYIDVYQSRGTRTCNLTDCIWKKNVFLFFK